jgi:hypothetical protein
MVDDLLVLLVDGVLEGMIESPVKLYESLSERRFTAAAEGASDDQPGNVLRLR